MWSEMPTLAALASRLRPVIGHTHVVTPAPAWIFLGVPICTSTVALQGRPVRRADAYPCPECRAAVAMVTGHQQSDPRVGRPGRESNPMLVLSQGTADVQSQGAMEERSPGTRRWLVSSEAVSGR